MSAIALVPTEERSESPVKPKDSAEEPMEEACEDRIRSVSDCEDGKQIEAGTGMNISEEDDLKVLPGDIVTKEMIEEEKQLKETALKEEQKLKDDQERLWKEMNANDRGQRYKRLQFLLSKSNMYTQYLIQRMKQQTEENKKKKERMMKQLARKEKKLEEQKEQEEKEGNSQPKAEDDVSSRKTRKRKGDTEIQASEVKSPKVQQLKKKQKVLKEKGESEKFSSASKENERVEAPNSNSEEMEEIEEELSHALCLSKRFINGEQVPDCQPTLFNGGVLRQYQADGFTWLKTLYENGVNGILADEMGLGKTVQCIAMVSHLIAMGVAGPFLVCAPLSTMPNWYSEFKRFTPRIPVVFYHGDQNERLSLRNRIRRKHFVRKNVEVHPCVITSYEIAMRDRKFLQNFDWKYLIVDEGHRIKNTNCRLIRELRMYRTTHRLLLTGTPLQNNLSELWSLLNFLLPEIFDDLGSFEAWFDIGHFSDEEANRKIVIEEQQGKILSMLHQILTPFMLRRLKSDVELLIPPKKEVMVMAPLTKLQQELYASTLDRTILQKIEKKNEEKEEIEVNAKGRPVRKETKKKVNYELMMLDDSDLKPVKNKAKEEEKLESWVQAVVDIHEKEDTSNKKKEKTIKKSQVTVRLQNIMMQLRKCCNHPYLLEHPIDQKTGDLVLNESIVKTSGKLLMLDRMVAELKKRGHKVLIFSQMTRMLDLIEDFCILRKYEYCRLDGSRHLQDRREQMDTFSNDPNKFLFLVSTRAGGLGLNLTAADTVIIYDSDWNPQCDLQAQDRCHRIGQTRPVVVYRFVSANTIDQRIIERAAAKRKLEKMVIHKGKFKSGMKNFTTSLTPLSPQELQALLMSNDHEVIIDGKDQVISNKELENLLDRSDLIQKFEEMKGKKSAAKKSKTKKTAEEGKFFKLIKTDVCNAEKAAES